MNRPQKVSQTPPPPALALVREKLVQELSLQPDSSSAHTVEAYKDGVRATLTRGGDLSPIYAYALPWARGWSVFVTPDPDANNHDWHRKATGFSQAVPNKRNVTGPENVVMQTLINAFTDAIDYMDFHYAPRPPACEYPEECGDNCDCDDIETQGPDDCVFYGHP